MPFVTTPHSQERNPNDFFATPPAVDAQGNSERVGWQRAEHPITPSQVVKESLDTFVQMNPLTIALPDGSQMSLDMRLKVSLGLDTQTREPWVYCTDCPSDMMTLRQREQGTHPDLGYPRDVTYLIDFYKSGSTKREDLIGTINLSESKDKTWGCHFIIVSFHVLGDRKGQGIGTQLLKYVLRFTDESYELNCDKIQLGPFQGRALFYAREGFRLIAPEKCRGLRGEAWEDLPGFAEYLYGKKPPEANPRNVMVRVKGAPSVDLPRTKDVADAGDIEAALRIAYPRPSI